MFIVSIADTDYLSGGNCLSMEGRGAHVNISRQNGLPGKHSAHKRQEPIAMSRIREELRKLIFEDDFFEIILEGWGRGVNNKYL
jgi:hypothetical protein